MADGTNRGRGLGRTARRLAATGPAVKAVVAYVRAHPGCCKADVQRGTGAGRPSIDRAIMVGLIGALRMDTPTRRYRLYAAPASGPGPAAGA